MLTASCLCCIGLLTGVGVVAGYGQPAPGTNKSTSPEERSTYVLGPEDQIIIRALHCEEISDKPFRIQPDGFLNLPLVGSVKAAGLTIPGLEAELTNRLRK